MHLILRFNFLIVILLSTELLFSQPIIKELHRSALSDTSYISLHNFQNGDLLLIEILHPDRHMQLSRLSPDLSTVIWSKIVKLSNLECDFIFPPNFDPNRFWYSFEIFVDNKDYIWLKQYSELPSTGIVKHLILLSQNCNFIWQKGFVFEHGYHHDYGGNFESLEDGINIYSQDFWRNNQTHDTLTLMSINYDGHAIIKSRLSHIELNHNNDDHYNHVSLSPDKDKILQLRALLAWRDSTFLTLSFLESKKSIYFNSEKRNLGFFGGWGTAEWINNEEFITYTFFVDTTILNTPAKFALLIARININGNVIWSKVTDVSKSFIHFYRWWNMNKAIMHIENGKLLIPLNGFNGSGSGIITLDIETGTLLDSKFWYKNGMDAQPSDFLKVGNNIYLQNYRTWHNELNVEPYAPFIMLDNLENPSGCMKIPVCDFILNDFPLEFKLVETPLQISNPNQTLVSRCNFEIEILPVNLDWREICPDVIQQPDALFTLSSDTICRRELVPVVVQYNHQYFEYTWHLNGTKIEPVSASNDTFYFEFDLEGESELHLTTSRLGCESEYAVSFFLVPGAQIEGPSDTIKCKGISIFLPLPVIDGYIIQWENGINPLRVDTAGIYTYTSIIPETGCRFSKSIQVTEKNAPKVNVDTFYSFCTEDIARSILPKAVGNVDKMEWIFPEQGNTLLVFPSKSDTYLLRVENATCVDTISVDILVQPCTDICPIFIPDAFSPNDDGINDFFEIFPGCSNLILSFRMEIFDRWGNMVFRSDEFNRQWDGNFEGKIAPAGGYTYKLKMTLESENEFEEVFREGFVGLVR